MELIDGWLVHTMPSGLEVAAGHNLQGISDINDERAGLVGHIVPLLVVSPNLETGDGDREEERGQTKVGVAVHAETVGCLLCLLLGWAEERVPEVAFSCWAAVRLDLVPEVVVF